MSDQESLAKALADAQNVPFVGPKQKKLAAAALAWFAEHQGPRVGTVTSVRDLALSPGSEEPDVTEVTIELPPTSAFREGQRVALTVTESEDR